MKIYIPYFTLIFVFQCLISCTNEKPNPKRADNEPKLIIKLNVNPNQTRLGNLGTPVAVPAGNAAQNPDFNYISAHYLEFSPTALTPLGSGAVVYHAPETNKGGRTAIEFSKSIIKKPGEVFLEIPLKDVPTGEYEWVRLSLSYQNYDVKFSYNGQEFTGTIASFVGYEQFIEEYTVKNQKITVNGNRKQGYWGAETPYTLHSGQAPEGATTVPNPLHATSPIPAGSCVVTGQFSQKLNISGNETNNIIVNMNLSTHQSFEWKDTNANDKWDVSLTETEQVVDMGLRGLIPDWNYQ